VRVVNQGTHPVVAEGAARMVLRSWVFDDSGRRHGKAGKATPLPRILLPGRKLAAVVAVPVPEIPGTFQVGFTADDLEKTDADNRNGADASDCLMELIVETKQDRAAMGCCVPLLETVQGALAQADQLQRLPNDYVDVTEGWFTRGKRWLKRKVLNNFKRAYVDVLSRQQSAFNQQVLAALHELAECCATLDHAGRVRSPQADRAEPVDRGDLAALRAAQAALRQSLREIEEGLAKLENERWETCGAPGGGAEADKKEVKV
jgi:hypothetical protein